MTVSLRNLAYKVNSVTFSSNSGKHLNFQKSLFCKLAKNLLQDEPMNEQNYLCKSVMLDEIGLGAVAVVH